MSEDRRDEILKRLDRAARANILGIEFDINPAALAKRVLEGRSLTLREREFIVGLLNGKTRPAQRPKSAETALRHDEIAQSYFLLKASNPGWQEKRLLSIVATAYDVKEKTVSRALKGLTPERRQNKQSLAAAFAESYVFKILPRRK